jgi:peptide/nickel transport system permease protein
MSKTQKLFTEPRFLFGLVILLVILLFMSLYPLFNRADPLEMYTSSFTPPGTTLIYNGQKNKMPLGTDNFGRDVLLELAYGTRTSLYVGLIAGGIITLIGLSLGLFSGYVGGKTDNIITTICNMFIVIPSFVVLILISYALARRSALSTALVVGFTGWPWMARAVRGQTTSLRMREHVNIARISGYSTLHIILTEILPYVASYVVMAFILAVASSILQEASLSMLGLGAQSTTISLGTLLHWALRFSAVVNGKWWAFFPAAMIIAGITFSMFMMNSGMDEILNPKIRS